MKEIRFSISKSMKRYLAEMMLIIMSVTLAFVLNEIRNNYNEQKKLTTSLEFIKEEITQNHIYVDKVISVQQKIVKKIDFLVVNEKYDDIYSPEYGFTYFNIYNESFFNQLLSSDAWNIANNNNIFDKMNIREVVSLSRAYEQQKYVMKAVWEIDDFFQSDVVFDETLTKTNCKILKNKLNSLIGLEVRLSYNYQQAENTLAKLID